uniref:DUF834 domain-containing protein n=1 Tax=Oryza rufipogon TaxID=4529 RepID=A0A0E0Q6K9_ORYRU
MRRRRPAVAEPSQLRATMRCRRRRGRAVHQAAPPPLGEDEEAIDKCARLLGLISPESLKTGDFCGGDWNIGLAGAAAPPRAGDHGFEVGRGGEVNEKGKEHTDEGEEAGEGEVLPGVSRGNGSAVAALPGVRRAGGETPVLMSGTRHDAMAMVRLTKVRMLFVRCRGGVRHSPEESALDDDVWAAARKKGKRKEEREEEQCQRPKD